MPDQTSAPVTSSAAVRALPAIQYRDYCDLQKRAAEHNSRRDTLLKGKPVVYKAPCELGAEKAKAAKPVMGPPAPAAKPEASTS